MPQKAQGRFCDDSLVSGFDFGACVSLIPQLQQEAIHGRGLVLMFSFQIFDLVWDPRLFSFFGPVDALFGYVDGIGHNVGKDAGVFPGGVMTDPLENP